MEGGGGVRKNEKKNESKGRLTPERNKRMRPPAPALAARSRTAMAAATDGQAPSTSEACTPVQPRRRRAPPPPRPPPQPRPRPDHFVALQCSASVAGPAFAALHASLRAAGLRATLVDAAAAHVTLGVVRLAAEAGAAPPAEGEVAPPTPPSSPPPLGGGWRPDPDPARLALAVGALHTAAAALRGASPLALALSPDVGTFGRRVVYLGVEDGDGGAALRAAEAAVRAALEGAGLVGEEGEEEEAGGGEGPPGGEGGDAGRRPRRPLPPPTFTPHVTVAKVPFGGRVRFIPPAAVAAAAADLRAAGWVGAPFQAGRLQLCAMGGRAAGEYYRVVAEVDFGG